MKIEKLNSEHYRNISTGQSVTNIIWKINEIIEQLNENTFILTKTIKLIDKFVNRTNNSFDKIAEVLNK